MERRERNTFEDLATVEPLLGTCPSMRCLDPIVETRPGQQRAEFLESVVYLSMPCLLLVPKSHVQHVVLTGIGKGAPVQQRAKETGLGPN